MARKKKRRARGKPSPKKRKRVIRKRALKRRKPAKFTAKSRAKKRGKPSRRELQDRIQRQEKIIKELADESRSRRKIRFVEEEEEEEEEIPSGPLAVPGERPVRDQEGEIIGYSLPETQEDFDDADFGDWDFFYDEIEEYLDENDHEADTGAPAK